MNQVLERLWIGDANDGRNIEALKSRGITAAFNATQETDGWPEDFKLNTPYLRLDQPDGYPISTDKLDRFKMFMDEQYEANKKTILIHCAAGISRASTFTILTLMLYHDMTWDAAENLVRSVRPIIFPHPLLKSSVLAWVH
jgi:predicted protein tyrosine phosphatase